VRQFGVLSTEQLRDLGLDKFGVRRRVLTGLLHPIHRGVYAVGRPDLSLRGRYLAAVLGSGPGAALSHRSAAHLRGLRPNAAGRVEVTIGWNQTGPTGVHTYRTRMLDPQDFTVIDGIPVTSVARTLLDLAGILRPPDLEVVIDRAERQGLFDSMLSLTSSNAPTARRARER
jgi:predicted transcriptional regulator of viral defense system